MASAYFSILAKGEPEIVIDFRPREVYLILDEVFRFVNDNSMALKEEIFSDYPHDEACGYTYLFKEIDEDVNVYQHIKNFLDNNLMTTLPKDYQIELIPVVDDDFSDEINDTTTTAETKWVNYPEQNHSHYFRHYTLKLTHNKTGVFVLCNAYRPSQIRLKKAQPFLWAKMKFYASHSIK